MRPTERRARSRLRAAGRRRSPLRRASRRRTAAQAREARAPRAQPRRAALARLRRSSRSAQKESSPRRRGDVGARRRADAAAARERARPLGGVRGRLGWLGVAARRRATGSASPAALPASGAPQPVRLDDRRKRRRGVARASPRGGVAETQDRLARVPWRRRGLQQFAEPGADQLVPIVFGRAVDAVMTDDDQPLRGACHRDIEHAAMLAGGGGEHARARGGERRGVLRPCASPRRTRAHRLRDRRGRAGARSCACSRPSRRRRERRSALRGLWRHARS